ncbi:hypothetical protein HWV62_3923 [Athelia sp. TMB]|nr:hypothetical protein HWV62_3923 [Athelia sp. TMB]
MHSQACDVASVLSLKLFHETKFHTSSLLCGSEITIGKLLELCRYGQDANLDLHATKSKVQGHIKIRLSLTNGGGLVISDAQKLVLDLVRIGDTAMGRCIDDAFSASLQMPPAVVAQPIADVLEKLIHFMKIADEVAKVHPYAKLAWDLLSAAHKIILAQVAIDQSIADLANTMQDIYSFVNVIKAEPKKIELLEDVIKQIFIQTGEYDHFYGAVDSKLTFNTGRVLRETMGASTPAKVAAMAANLIKLQDRFNTGVTLQIAMVSFRMHEDVTAILKTQTLALLGPSGDNLSRRSLCLPGTRRAVIRGLQNWALQPSEDDGSNVVWLHSVAGAGKSSVVATLATQFAEIGRLGAFIGFDRASTENIHPHKVVQAFAHQIALYDGRIAASIIKSIVDDGRILTASLSKQFDTLIVKSLTSVPGLHGEGPIVIVLDGLDECGQQGGRKTLLEVLARQTKALPSNVRFIISSRTIGDIHEAFTVPAALTRSQELGLGCEASNHSDIAAYFSFRMQEIRYKNKHLKENWPSTGDMAELTARADGFFLWAVAASNFVDSHNPLKRLADLLGRKDFTIPGADYSLDDFYRAALNLTGNWTDEYFVQDFRAIVGAVIALPISISLEAMESGLDYFVSETLSQPAAAITVRRLGSLLTQGPAVRILHPSFLDFLADRERCGCENWRLERGPSGSSSSPAAQCLQRMNAGLKRNICNLKLSAVKDDAQLPEELRNACEHWVEYVCSNVEHQFWVMRELQIFLCTHLLHWFEVMGLIKKTADIVSMLERTAAWLAKPSGSSDKTLRMLVIDAIKFARSFAADIAEHPLYVYYTALPLHPPDSIPYQTFHDSRVDTSVCVLRDDSNIAYSSDGRRYAAWDANKEHGDIVVKETATGQELLKITNNGKFRYVESVAFSYDGSRISVGAGSSGVYIWVSVAGAEFIGPLSHSTSSDWVYAVAWSTNGERLVSGSLEGEMIMWDTASAKGNRLSTTRLPDSPWIASVAFFSDDSQIAGCSRYGRVFVWDPLGGSIVWSVEIPGCYLPRISFSPDDRGEFLLVKWDGGAQAHDLSTGDLLPPPDSVASAVGLSRGGFMVDLLYRRMQKDMRWEDDEDLKWGAHGEYFAFRIGESNAWGRRVWQHHVVLLPKGVD